MSDYPSPIVRALAVVVGHVLGFVEQFDLALVAMDDLGGALEDPA